jgi:hypothetical protein
LDQIKHEKEMMMTTTEEKLIRGFKQGCGRNDRNEATRLLKGDMILQLHCLLLMEKMKVVNKKH